MNRWPIRVIKVGGSLLNLALLPQRFTDWLERQSSSHNVIVVGCGTLADAIRDADQRFHLGEATSHSLCIDLLSVTTRLFHAIVERRWEVAESIETLLSSLESCSTSSVTQILDAGKFMRHDDLNSVGSSLPHRWDVTSDSIAARVATILGAHELALLKSASPSCLSRQAIAYEGYTDLHFPIASCDVPVVRAIDFRSPQFEEVTLVS